MTYLSATISGTIHADLQSIMPAQANGVKLVAETVKNTLRFFLARSHHASCMVSINWLDLQMCSTLRSSQSLEIALMTPDK